MIHALMVLIAIVGAYKLGFRRGTNAGAKEAAAIAIELVELHYRKDFECQDGAAPAALATSKTTPQSTGKRERFSDAYPQYVHNGWQSRRNES